MKATDSATRLAAIVARAKRDNLDDIARGVVPATVDTVDELYTYVDANRYGGLTDDESTSDLVSQDTDLVISPHTRRAFSDQRPEGALACSIACRDEPAGRGPHVTTRPTPLAPDEPPCPRGSGLLSH